MNHVGILANPRKPVVWDLIPRFLRWTEKYGLSVSIEAHLARFVEDDGLRTACRVVDSEEDIVAGVDWVIAMGGDGTLLKGARLVGASETPLLGVNTGTLGFLMQTTPDEMILALDHIRQGQYRLEKRMVLLAEVIEGGSQAGHRSIHTALNDVVVDKGAVSRAIDVVVIINGEYVNTVVADGLILATPTGSTAYSLSAGGPIVTPTLEAMIVAPICPHTLSNRSMVLSSDDRVSIEVRADHPGMVFTVDGQESHPLQSGDRVDIRRAPYSINLINCGTRSFYEVLRTKLKWGER